MSKVLDYNYATEVISNYKESVKAKNEKNDCFVRAVASASGSSYEAAHGFVKETFKRQDGQGTMFVDSTMLELEGKLQEFGQVKVRFEKLPKNKIKNTYKLYGELIDRQKTVKSFIKDNSRGTFVVLVSGHAFTIRDGVLIDNRGEEFRPTRKVQSAYRVIEETVDPQLKLF
tara:strand:+ start:441 stop:956 length:516 start_codon:yes stop_codon:yes gene_type:complete